MQVLHQIYPNASNLSRLTLWSLLRRNKHKKCVILFVTLFNLDYSCQLLNSKKLIETELWRGKRVNYPIKYHRTLTKTLLSTAFLLLQLKHNTTFFLHSSKEVYFLQILPRQRLPCRDCLCYFCISQRIHCRFMKALPDTANQFKRRMKIISFERLFRPLESPSLTLL